MATFEWSSSCTVPIFGVKPFVKNWSDSRRRLAMTMNIWKNLSLQQQCNGSVKKTKIEGRGGREQVRKAAT